MSSFGVDRRRLIPRLTPRLVREKYSVGILGAGAISFDCHLPVLLSSAEASVSWVTDRDTQKAKAVARSFGVRHTALPSDVGELPLADVVLVAVPYGSRPALYPQLSRRFPAIYVEKPLAQSLVEHDRWCGLWRPERFACGYQRRSMGAVRALRQIVETRLFGRLRRIRVEFGAPGIKTSGRYAATLAMAGGGILFEAGVHALDAALHACGATATERVSVHMIRSHGFDVHTDAHLRVQRGEESDVDLDLLVSSLEYTTNDLVFSFENASVTVSIFGNTDIRVTATKGNASFIVRGGSTYFPNTAHQVFHEHWSRFFTALRTGLPNDACAVSSRVTSQAIEQLYDTQG